MAKLLAGIFILILASIVKKIVATNFKKLACKISCIEKVCRFFLFPIKPGGNFAEFVLGLFFVGSFYCGRSTIVRSMNNLNTSQLDDVQHLLG